MPPELPPPTAPYDLLLPFLPSYRPPSCPFILLPSDPDIVAFNRYSPFCRERRHTNASDVTTNLFTYLPHLFTGYQYCMSTWFFFSSLIHYVPTPALAPPVSHSLLLSALPHAPYPPPLRLRELVKENDRDNQATRGSIL